MNQTPILDKILRAKEELPNITIYHAGDKCPWCAENGNKNRLKVRQGYVRSFLGCTRYPACGFSTDFND